MHAMATTLIEPAALLPHLADPQWAVVDCRFDLARPDWGEQAFGAGHIPHALYVHLEHDLSGPRSAPGGRHRCPTRPRSRPPWGVSVSMAPCR